MAAEPKSHHEESFKGDVRGRKQLVIRSGERGADFDGKDVPTQEPFHDLLFKDRYDFFGFIKHIAR